MLEGADAWWWSVEVRAYSFCQSRFPK
jgi:hypothetical protein